MTAQHMHTFVYHMLLGAMSDRTEPLRPPLYTFMRLDKWRAVTAALSVREVAREDTDVTHDGSTDSGTDFTEFERLCASAHTSMNMSKGGFYRIDDLLVMYMWCASAPLVTQTNADLCSGGDL